MVCFQDLMAEKKKEPAGRPAGSHKIPYVSVFR